METFFARFLGEIQTFQDSAVRLATLLTSNPDLLSALGELECIVRTRPDLVPDLVSYAKQRIEDEAGAAGTAAGAAVPRDADGADLPAEVAAAAVGQQHAGQQADATPVPTVVPAASLGGDDRGPQLAAPADPAQHATAAAPSAGPLTGSNAGAADATAPAAGLPGTSGAAGVGPRGGPAGQGSGPGPTAGAPLPPADAAAPQPGGRPPQQTPSRGRGAAGDAAVGEDEAFHSQESWVSCGDAEQLELQLDTDVDMDASAPSGRESPAPTPAATAADNAGRGAEADKAAAGGAGSGSAGPSGAAPAAGAPATAGAAGAAAAGTADAGRTGAAGPSSQPAAGPVAAAAAKAGEAARDQGSEGEDDEVVMEEGGEDDDEEEEEGEEDEEGQDENDPSPDDTWYFYGHPVRGMSANWPGLTKEMREGWCNEFRARVKTTALDGSVTFTPAHKETRRELLKAFLRPIPGGPLDAAGPSADAGVDEEVEEEAAAARLAAARAGGRGDPGPAGWADAGMDPEDEELEDMMFTQQLRTAEEEEEVLSEMEGDQATEPASPSGEQAAPGSDGEEGDGPVDRAAVTAAAADLAAANIASIAAAAAARALHESATAQDAAAAGDAAAEAGGAEGAAAAAAVGGRRKKGAPARRADAAAAAEAAEAAAEDPALAARVEGILRATGTEESLLPAATRNLVRELVGQMGTGAGAGGSGAAGRLDRDALARLLARLGAEVERLREAWAQSRERLELRAHAVSHWTEARQPAGAAAIAFAAIASASQGGAAAKPSTKADAWRQELERQQALVADVCREVADKYRSDEAGLERDLKKYVSVLSVYVSRSEQLRLLLALAGGSRQEAAEAQAEARAELRTQRGAGAAGGGSSKGKGKQAGAAAANGGRKGASSEDDEEEESEADGSYDSSFIDDDGAEGQAEELAADAEGGAAAAEGEGQGDEEEGSPAGPNAATGLAPNQTEVLLGFRALDRQRQQAQAQAEAEAKAGHATKGAEPQGPRKPRGKGKPTRAPDTAPAAAEDAMEMDGGAAAPGPAAAAADANGAVAMETDGSGGAAAGSTDGEDAGEAETEGEAASHEGSEDEEEDDEDDVEITGMVERAKQRARAGEEEDEEDGVGSHKGTSSVRPVPLVAEAFRVGSAVDIAQLPTSAAKAARASPAAAAGPGTGSSDPGDPDKRREPPRNVLAEARERAGEPAFRLWQTGGRVIGASRAGRRGVRYTVAVPSGREGDDDDVREVHPRLLRPAALGQSGAASHVQSALETAGMPVLKRGLLLQQFRRGSWRPALVLAASKDHTAASGGRTWAELRQHLPPAPRKAPPPNPNAPRSEGGSSWSGWPWAKVEYKHCPPVRNFTPAESDRLPPAWANRPRASVRTAGHVADVREFGDASYVNALPPLPALGTTDVPQLVTHVQLLDFRGYLETPKRGKAPLRPHVHKLTNDQLVNERLAAPLLWWQAKQTGGSEGQWTRVPADPVLARLGFHVGGIITDYRLRQKVTKLKEDAGADAAGGPQAASALRSLQARTVARALARRPSADVESTHKEFGPSGPPRRRWHDLGSRTRGRQAGAGANSGEEQDEAEEEEDEQEAEAARRGRGSRGRGARGGAEVPEPGPGRKRRRSSLSGGDEEDDDDAEGGGGDVIEIMSSGEDEDGDGVRGAEAGRGGGRSRGRGRGRGRSDGPPPAKKVKENVQKFLDNRSELRRLAQQARAKRLANVPLRDAEEDQGGRRLFQDRAEPKLPACIAGRLKGHQLEGLRFMWECLVDVHRDGSELVDSAGGCILAHSMGLGKTLSTIALIHMFLGQGMGQGQGPAGPGPSSSSGGSGPSQDPGDGLEGRRRALLVVPANVLHNFYIELRAWLPEEGSEDEALSRLTIKKVYMWQNDPEVIQRWHSEEGSVLIATSGKLRHLVLVPGSGGGGAPEGAPGSAVAAPKRRGRPPRSSAPPAVPAPEAMAAAEAAERAEGAAGEEREEGEDPEAGLPTGEAAATRKTELRRMVLEGCGLVVVDEAHELRNPTSQLYKAMCLVATRRRLALTGYPLQNNLSEYYTMLNWVQPDLLGTPEEFKKNYASKIEKGQTKDASASDRRRANIHLQLLRDATDAFIHRAGPEILEAELPPKSEVVLLLDMNERQREFYRGYLELLTECGEAPQLFRDFAMLSRLLNQPRNFERLMQQAAEAGGSGTVELEGAEAEEGEGLRLQLSPARPNIFRRATPPAPANPEATTVAAPAPRPPLAPAGDAPGAATQLMSPLVQRQLSFGAAAAAEAAEAGAVAEGAGPSTAGAGPETAAGGRATGPRRGKKRDTGAGSKEDDHIVQLPSLLVERLHERFKALRAQATQEQAEGQQGAGGGGGGGSESAGPDVDPLWGPLPKTLFVQKLLRICQEAGERLVFFTQSLGVLNDVQALLEGSFRYRRGVEFFRIDGTVPSKKRQEAIDEFNASGRARVMLVSSKAGSLGINLTSACRLVIVDVPWNPVWNAQAIARIFRMGQKRPTYVYRLLYAATLEELVYDLNVDKEELFVKVVDKKSVRKDHAALAQRWSYEAPPRMSSEDALHRLQGLAEGPAGAGAAAGGSVDAEGGGRDAALLQLAQDPEVRAPLVNAFPHKSRLPPDPSAMLSAEDLEAARKEAAIRGAGRGADRRRGRLKRNAGDGAGGDGSGGGAGGSPRATQATQDATQAPPTQAQTQQPASARAGPRAGAGAGAGPSEGRRGSGGVRVGSVLVEAEDDPSLLDLTPAEAAELQAKRAAAAGGADETAGGGGPAAPAAAAAAVGAAGAQAAAAPPVAGRPGLVGPSLVDKAFQLFGDGATPAPTPAAAGAAAKAAAPNAAAAGAGATPAAPAAGQGLVLARGPGVMQGYFRDPEAGGGAPAPATGRGRGAKAAGRGARPGTPQAPGWGSSLVGKMSTMFGPVLAKAVAAAAGTPAAPAAGAAAVGAGGGAGASGTAGPGGGGADRALHMPPYEPPPARAPAAAPAARPAPPLPASLLTPPVPGGGKGLAAARPVAPPAPPLPESLLNPPRAAAAGAAAAEADATAAGRGRGGVAAGNNGGAGPGEGGTANGGGAAAAATDMGRQQGTLAGRKRKSAAAAATQANGSGTAGVQPAGTQQPAAAAAVGAETLSAARSDEAEAAAARPATTTAAAAAGRPAAAAAGAAAPATVPRPVLAAAATNAAASPGSPAKPLRRIIPVPANGPAAAARGAAATPAAAGRGGGGKPVTRSSPAAAAAPAPAPAPGPNGAAAVQRTPGPGAPAGDDDVIDLT